MARRPGRPKRSIVSQRERNRECISAEKGNAHYQNEHSWKPRVISPTRETTIRDIEAVFSFPPRKLGGHLPSKKTRSDIEELKKLRNSEWKAMIKAADRVLDATAQVLCPANPLALKNAVLTKVEPDISRNKELKMLRKLRDTVIRHKSNAKKNSAALRHFRAALSVLPRQYLLELGETSLAAQGKIYRQARQDCELLHEGEDVMPKKRTLVRYDKGAVEDAVKFITSPSNVGILSWGTKLLVVDEKKYFIPALSRKRNKARIYQSYVLWCKANHPQSVRNENNYEGISRSKFMEIVAALTSGQARLIKSVDYVTGFLVNDNLETLCRLVCSFFPNDTIQSELEHLLLLAKVFLKYQYDAHVTPVSDCPSHSIVHSLGSQVFSSCEGASVECAGCKFPFWVLGEVEKLILPNHDEALEVLTWCREKVHLYMGHRVRVLNQQIAIREAIEGMEHRCEENKVSNEAHVILDYKMKFDAMYFREKTTEHYGKRGISWHGAMILFFIYDQTLRKAVKQTIYFDDVSFGENKQDAPAVISLVECLLMRLRKRFPHLTKVSFQSDNASCYMSLDLLVMLPILSIVHGVQVTRFIHTGIQDGKSSLDAHFASFARWVTEYLKEGHNALTASQLVTAMKSNGGLPNTFVRLIRHDRKQLDNILNSIKHLSKAMAALKVRSADSIFELTSLFSDSSSFQGIESIPPFTIICHPYSGVGRGTRVYVDPSGKTCVVQGGENFENDDFANFDRRVDNISYADDQGSEQNVEETDPEKAVQEREIEEILQECEGQDGEITQGNGAISSDDSELSAPVTGIRIMSESELRRLQQRWRKPAPRRNRDLLLSTEGYVENEFDGNVAEQRKDMLSYAKRYALHILREGTLGVRGGRQDVTGEYPQCENYDIPASVSWNNGWARRPKHGELYGKRSISPYRDEIRQLFEAGAQNEGYKQSAASMHEALLHKYPRKFNVPSEGEIRTEIQRLCRLHKLGRDLCEPVTGKRGRKGMKNVYSSVLEELVREDPGIKPKFGLQRFKEILRDSACLEDFPTDQQVKSKISSIKQALRGNQE